MTLAAKPETSGQPIGCRRCGPVGQISAQPIFCEWALNKNNPQNSIDFGLVGFQPMVGVARVATGQQEYQSPPWVGQLARAVHVCIALGVVAICLAHS